MTILLSTGDSDNNQLWQQELQKHTDLPVSIYPEIDTPEDINYALVWKHPQGDLARYPNLRAILSLAAGVEHIILDPELPRVPIVRLADPAMSQAMANYCLYWTLAYQRRFDLYPRQQRNSQWQSHSYPENADFTVGLLGLGAIGGVIATALAGNGYKVKGWSNRPKNLASVTSYSGQQQQAEFLADLDLLVNCLPHTQATTGMINADFLQMLSPGCFFINIGRSSVLQQHDFVQALDNGSLAAATLDVFDHEPLIEDSPFWQHPQVHVTPHIAGPTRATTAAPLVVANIQRIENDEQPFPLYQPRQGY